MQRRDDSALRIVIVDYQSCAFSPTNLTDKHFLSPVLINFLAKEQYDFFIGHTFRCIVNVDEFKSLLLEKVPASEQAKFVKAFPTSQITKHIAKHANTTCLTVATLDDMVTGQVGLGYEDLIDYENNKVINHNEHVRADQQYHLMKQNNQQLLLIAQHIAKWYPGKKVMLDIIDDDLNHCREALAANQQAGWPENISLNKIYRYSTKVVNDKVTEISDAARMNKRQDQHHCPAPKRLAISDSRAASALVTGTFGTFTRAPAASAAVASEPQEPRRSARLAGKSQKHY